jgi:hypothetical protein
VDIAWIEALEGIEQIEGPFRKVVVQERSEVALVDANFGDSALDASLMDLSAQQLRRRISYVIEAGKPKGSVQEQTVIDPRPRVYALQEEHIEPVPQGNESPLGKTLNS